MNDAALEPFEEAARHDRIVVVDRDAVQEFAFFNRIPELAGKHAPRNRGFVVNLPVAVFDGDRRIDQQFVAPRLRAGRSQRKIDLERLALFGVGEDDLNAVLLPGRVAGELLVEGLIFHFSREVEAVPVPHQHRDRAAVLRGPAVAV